MKNFCFRLCAAILTFSMGTVVSVLWLNRNPIAGPAAQKIPEIVNVPTLQVPRGVGERPHIPVGWYRVSANGLFSFYLPKNMKMSIDERSLEARWGSNFSNGSLGLYAEYSSWPNEGYSTEFLGRQLDNEKEIIEINSRKAQVHSWRWAEPRGIYKYGAELRIYDLQDKMFVRMLAGCQERHDVEIAKQIFSTVQFP